MDDKKLAPACKAALHVMSLSLGSIFIFWLLTGQAWLFALILPAAVFANIYAFTGKDK